MKFPLFATWNFLFKNSFSHYITDNITYQLHLHGNYGTFKPNSQLELGNFQLFNIISPLTMVCREGYSLEITFKKHYLDVKRLMKRVFFVEFQ